MATRGCTMGSVAAITGEGASERRLRPLDLGGNACGCPPEPDTYEATSRDVLPPDPL
ncbi:MAG: hypothetical protein AAF928_03630 [Myxococcota bacterium]